MGSLHQWARSWAAGRVPVPELVVTRGEGEHLDVFEEAFPGALVASLAGRDARPRPRRLLVASSERLQRVAATGMALGLETFRANPPDELAGPGGEELDAILSAARVEAAVEQSTLRELGPLFLANLRANLSRLLAAPPLAAALPALRGRGLLVLGSGASLEEILPTLPAWRQRSLLVAATSALPALRRAGIRPDLAAVIEPRHCPRHFEGLPGEWLGGIVLLADAVTHPAHLDLPWRRVIPFAGPVADWIAPAIGQGSGVPTGGNVGTAMLVLGWFLGAHPVMAAGLDFAFVGERFYAGGVPNTPHPEADLTVPSWSGAPLRTSYPLASFLVQTERILATIGERDPRARFLVLTHRGARIRGAIPVDPQGLLPALDPVPRDESGHLPLPPVEPPPWPAAEPPGEPGERLVEQGNAIAGDPAGPVAGLLFLPAPSPALRAVVGSALLRAREEGCDPVAAARKAVAELAETVDQVSRARRTTSR